MIGNAVAGPLANRYGRRAILIATALLFTVSAAWSGLATSFWTLVIARVIGGLGVGAAILIAPIYIAEIALPASRGRLVSFNQLNIVIGISAAFFSNFFINGAFDSAVAWRWMLGVEAVPAFLYFVLLFSVPCSPRWLLSVRRRGEAEDAISKLGGDAADIAGFVDGADESSKAAGGSVGELFSSRMRRILTLALALAFFQQITGINAIFYYAATIFGKAGAATEPALMQGILIGLTNLVFTSSPSALIDRAGRRPSSWWGARDGDRSAHDLVRLPVSHVRATPLLIEKSRTDKQAAFLAPLEGTTFEDRDSFMAALDGKATERGITGVELEAFTEGKESIANLAASDETDAATYELTGEVLAKMAGDTGLAHLQGLGGHPHRPQLVHGRDQGRRLRGHGRCGPQGVRRGERRTRRRLFSSTVRWSSSRSCSSSRRSPCPRPRDVGDALGGLPDASQGRRDLRRGPVQLHRELHGGSAVPQRPLRPGA